MSIASGTGAPVAHPPVPEPAPVVPAGPVAVSFSPPADGINVPTSPNLIVEFDKAVMLGTGTAMLMQADNVTDVWDMVADAGTGAGQVNVFQGTQLTMRLTTPLAAATDYYVIWDAGVVKDLAGNDVAAQPSTILWSFTTGTTGSKTSRQR